MSSVRQPDPHNHTGGETDTPVDPSALDSATEAAFGKHWSTWADAHWAMRSYLEAAWRAIAATAGSYDEQRDALDNAAEEACELLRLAHDEQIRAVEGDGR